MMGYRLKFWGPITTASYTTERQFRQMIAEAWEEVGKYWHEKLAPKHFTREGAREYGYKPRSGEVGGVGGTGGKAFWRSYTGRKQRYLGHTLPLVFSGELRDRTLGMPPNIEARSTPTRTTLKIRLTHSQKANWRNKYSDIKMHEELKTISEAEERELNELFDQIMQRKYDELKAQAT